MKVLIACEESQIECLAFRSRGHLAFSCDLQKCSGGHPEWHIKCDVLEVLYDSWDLVIAHPPCTYLSNAGVWLMKTPERFLECEKAAQFFMDLYNAPCPRVCVENPVPHKYASLPPYSQIIQPWQFGSIYNKRTCLWLRGLPDLVPGPFYTGPKRSFVYSRRSSFARSKSFPEIAFAMAAQWSF